MRARSRTWQSLLLNATNTCVVISNWGMTIRSASFTRWKAFDPLVTPIFGTTMKKKLKTTRRTSLKGPRTRAFISQNGMCYYCNQPMWNKTPLELVSRYHISSAQARSLRCTGEHLVSYSKGGKSGTNIVAACQFCNHHRHRRKSEPSPDEFIQHVRKRLSNGRWHGLKLTR